MFHQTWKNQLKRDYWFAVTKLKIQLRDSVHANHDATADCKICTSVNALIEDMPIAEQLLLISAGDNIEAIDALASGTYSIYRAAWCTILHDVNQEMGIEPDDDYTPF